MGRRAVPGSSRSRPGTGDQPDAVRLRAGGRGQGAVARSRPWSTRRARSPSAQGHATLSSRSEPTHAKPSCAGQAPRPVKDTSTLPSAITSRYTSSAVKRSAGLHSSSSNTKVRSDLYTISQRSTLPNPTLRCYIVY